MANQWRVMSEYYKEQHPLLCEEISDEEYYSPRYHRNIRNSNYRGRPRHSLNGAASIITRWPDHWSSFLAYWWIGLGMISLTTFIIYNSLFAFSMIPTANTKPSSLILGKSIEKSARSTSSLLPDVFMHVFVKHNEEINLNQYVPYIEELASKYPNLKYHLVVVVNDTNLSWLSAEENNELALNSLWKKEQKKEPSKANVAIEYVTMTSYMQNSPLRKHWKTLPNQLIEFLARSVSIWEKGGIAFNPVILTPKSQRFIYSEKINKLLNKYSDRSNVPRDIKNNNKPRKTIKKERKLNNIRDIIHALENDDESVNAFSEQTLTEAENIKSQVVTKNDHYINGEIDTTIKNESEKASKTLNVYENYPHKNSFRIDDDTKEPKHRIGMNNSTESTVSVGASQNTTKLSLLPLFLEFIFHNKLNTKPSSTETTTLNRTRKSVIEIPKSGDIKSSLSAHSLDKMDKKMDDTYKPVIVSAAEIYNKSEFMKPFVGPPGTKLDEILEQSRLTIDLKGNIIATDIPCHAFLGTIFSNAAHHSQEESVTDFIIAELTLFCKGLLSSCMGIDLILI
ncbi:unnamed protein product [Spodoptera littoralis]|uniref:Uncharacterized protein n=1 Tax=Spodoptera littoralis TaxID=7109 RepID=A0A9P0IGN4_SPOLI|nr:unnamed protein product [Spodoptera littoralis]CAH1645492.1 unnamed protein product [Spodoptera littoralis]